LRFLCSQSALASLQDATDAWAIKFKEAKTKGDIVEFYEQIWD